ncbi:uncharacterized protein LOC107635871 [Arachis ipaensis]|uniref:uncharacterized protein LOC107635871 n=1 Tax=Arachis ipaensis TaxID=130454 RepID=UPI0007AFA1FB|nr:uncharacterized protein LOC107635871 [Arachis ipaensis]
MDALASVGESMKESDHVNAILHSLTEEYGNVMTSVLARSTSITLGELEALLLANESMLARFRKSESFLQANVAQHSQHSQIQQNQFYSQSSTARENYRGNFRGRPGRIFRGSSRGAHDAERMTQDAGRFTQDGDYGRAQYGRGRMMQGGRPQCQVCDRVGHTAKFCWYRYDKEQYKDINGITQPKANYSNVLATPSTVQDPNWYPDSGATHHMTHDAHNLMEKEAYTRDEQVVIGDGSCLHIHHRSAAQVLMSSHPSTKWICKEKAQAHSGNGPHTLGWCLYAN